MVSTRPDLAPVLARRGATRPARPSVLASLGGRLSRRRWFVIVGLLATLLPALAMVAVRDAEYRADAVIVLQTSLLDDLAVGALDDGTLAGGITGGLTGLDSGPDRPVADLDRRVENEITFLEGDLVRAQVELQLGSTDVPRARGIAARGDTIVVRVEAATPQLAQLVANTYARAYVTARSAQIDRLGGAALSRLQTWTAESRTALAQLEAQTAAEGSTPERDAEVARLTVEIAALEQVLERLQLALALDLVPAEVVADADSAVDVGSADLWRTVVAALAAGLLLGIASAVIIDVADDTVRTADDLARVHPGARPLALVPDDPSAVNGTAALRRSQDPASVAYRVLRNQLLAVPDRHQVVQLTSIDPGDGATTIAANLAVTLAEHGGTVVIVDLDLHTPTVHTAFGVDGSFGVVEVLAGDPLDLAVLPLDDRIHLLAAGTVPPDPSSLVAGTALDALVRTLRSRYDHVVIDTPPLATADDATFVAPHGDLLLLVVAAGRTGGRQLRRAALRFDELNVAIDGYVLNRALLRERIGRRRLAPRS